MGRQREIERLEDRISEARTHASWRVVERLERELEAIKQAGETRRAA